MAQTLTIARIEESADVLFAVRHEVAVGRIKLGNRSAHDAREVEE